MVLVVKGRGPQGRRHAPIYVALVRPSASSVPRETYLDIREAVQVILGQAKGRTGGCPFLGTACAKGVGQTHCIGGTAAPIRSSVALSRSVRQECRASVGSFRIACRANSEYNPGTVVGQILPKLPQSSVPFFLYRSNSYSSRATQSTYRSGPVRKGKRITSVLFNFSPIR